MTQSKQMTVVDGIKKMEGEFKSALPDHIKPERFVRNAVTVINSNPDLLQQDVNKRSLYGSVMKAAQDGLVVDGREAALVSFKNGKTGERIVQYIPMTEGLMKLVRNSGEISVISVHVVKENDKFDYELGDNERMIHKPALTSRGKTIGAYSIVTFKDGGKSREWMDIDQINAIMNRKKFPNPIWKTDYDEMARKTVFRRHAKRLPKSTDLDDVLQHDNEVDGLDDVTRVSRNVEPEGTASEPKKETKASKAVKSKSKAKKEEDENVSSKPETEIIDVEYSEVEQAEEYNDEEIPM
jgi:recombination protein RecT